ncbi:MAG: RNA polymerase sigma factor [Phycisphaerae bacterium]|nr:RNA polymerase sigma factor [Phycisphaerae bacterium]
MTAMNSDRLAVWYDAYSASLTLYARAWLGHDGAQDAVQAAFVRLMGQSTEPTDIHAWLFRTVRNEAITRLRRRQCRRRHDRQLSSQQASWFEGRPDDLIDARRAQEILETLPEPQREVVLLRIWGQLSLAQIVGIVGGSTSTIHSRYKAALAAIKERMERPCKTKD